MSPLNSPLALPRSEPPFEPEPAALVSALRSTPCSSTREPVFAEDLRVQVRAAQTGHAALPRLARHLVHGRALGRLEVELRVTWRGEGDLLEPDVERRRSRAVRIDRDPQRRAVVGVDGDGDLADQRA